MGSGHHPEYRRENRGVSVLQSISGRVAFETPHLQRTSSGTVCDVSTREEFESLQGGLSGHCVDIVKAANCALRFAPSGVYYPRAFLEKRRARVTSPRKSQIHERPASWWEAGRSCLFRAISSALSLPTSTLIYVMTDFERTAVRRNMEFQWLKARRDYRAVGCPFGEGRGLEVWIEFGQVTTVN